MVKSHTGKANTMIALRYWFIWALLLGALGYGMHRYFEYRNQELDKRLERLRQ